MDLLAPGPQVDLMRRGHAALTAALGDWVGVLAGTDGVPLRPPEL